MKEMPVRKKTHPVDEGNPPPSKEREGREASVVLQSGRGAPVSREEATVTMGS